MTIRFRASALALGCASCLAASLTTSLATSARAEPRPNGPALVRLLGSNAPLVLSPAAKDVGALVRVPRGKTAASLGIAEVAPGIGRLRGSPEALTAFASMHPDARLEVAPPLHTLLDRAGGWIRSARFRQEHPGADGAGVFVGVADTGLDVSHPHLRDANGKTRIAWMLDLSLAPLGIYPDLEQKYGVVDANGKVVAGAVLGAKEIDALLASGQRAPGDEVGHGTHVTSIAAGDGGGTAYVGAAPRAGILFARVTRDASDSIDNDDLVRGVQFLFDRADSEKKPVVVNLSLGSDFGPHDGTLLWEEAIASFVGPEKAGHALVVAAGNSGSIAESPVHQSVAVTPGTAMHVPIDTQGAQNGAVQIWVALRQGADMKVGLEGPDGEWIAPIASGDERGKNTSAYKAAVINGASASDSPVPSGSRGAVVVWSGKWPKGRYSITLDGRGTVDLFLQTGGDVRLGSGAGFAGAVREGTINLPGTHPSIIAVGCTVNRTQWTSIDKVTEAQLVPVLDAVGGQPVYDPLRPGHVKTRELTEGEACWFSSAGPTLNGTPKPEISAPGGIVIAAMSKQAAAGTPGSIFTTACPTKGNEGGGTTCLQVDTTHAVSQGTSMSAPLVAGAIALLFQQDPTLTQDKVRALLQAGAHPIRGTSPFEDQAGPGELDVIGTLDALDQMHNPAEALPSADASWITLSADYAAADGQTPMTAIVELRTANGAHRADFFDAPRLAARVVLDGRTLAPPTLQRRGPGVWVYSYAVPPGHGGGTVTFGATFDGEDIVAAKTVPVGADVWRAEYASEVKGGCHAGSSSGGGLVGVATLTGLLALVRRRRPRSDAPRG